MPLTLGLYMIGAFAISAVPLFSGFVSKSMVVAAAGESHRAAIFLALTMASAGTFLHTGLKLPYYMFFGTDSRAARPEPPREHAGCDGHGRGRLHRRSASSRACCTRSCPTPSTSSPTRCGTCCRTLGVLSFTALGFVVLLLTHLDPEPTISLDTDWFYRRGCRRLMAHGAWSRSCASRERPRRSIYECVVRRLLLGTAARLRQVDASVVDPRRRGRRQHHRRREPEPEAGGDRPCPALRRSSWRPAC